MRHQLARAGIPQVDIDPVGPKLRPQNLGVILRETLESPIPLIRASSTALASTVGEAPLQRFDRKSSKPSQASMSIFNSISERWTRRNFSFLPGRHG